MRVGTSGCEGGVGFDCIISRFAASFLRPLRVYGILVNVATWHHPSTSTRPGRYPIEPSETRPSARCDVMFQDEQRRANFRCVFSGLGGRQTEVDASIDARGVITCQARHVTVLLPVFLFPTLTEVLLRVLLHLVVPLRRRNRIAQRSASNYLGVGKSSVARRQCSCYKNTEINATDLTVYF